MIVQLRDKDKKPVDVQVDKEYSLCLITDLTVHGPDKEFQKIIMP